MQERSYLCPIGGLLEGMLFRIFFMRLVMRIHLEFVSTLPYLDGLLSLMDVQVFRETALNIYQRVPSLMNPGNSKSVL